MPAATWTSLADFSTWTLVDVSATVGGELEVAVGAQYGTATSPITQPTGDWYAHTGLKVASPAVEGTACLMRFRTGASSSECGAASWSEYLWSTNDSGSIIVCPHGWHLNNPAAPYGRYLQVELTLMRE